MHAAERALLESTVTDAIAGAPDGADGILEELGSREMLAAEPDDAIAIVFGALGRANATASMLDDVVVSGLGLAPSPDLAVLLPPFAAWDPPGTGRGLATGRVATATEVLVVTNGGAVRVPKPAVDATPVHGVDPDAGLHRLHVPELAGPRAAVDWPAGVACGRRALAHQIEGACRAMLELARTHALDRVQFGRPIARFQAVRHRLADALVSIEALEAALGAARDEPNPTTAACAKALAGRTARTVAAHCQQVLAGVGFTTEHPFHRYMKRTMVLDGLFGSGEAITADLGRTLLATRTVPTLLDL
jgi:hypothetical protein